MIWKESDFYQDICSEENKLNLPPPKKLPGAKDRLPYYFVGDDAFALGEHMMKRVPSTSAVYAERVYNYRLSRARRVVKNAFGMLANRFRILHRPQDMEPEGVKVTVMTMAVLHNFLISKSKSYYMAKGQVDWEDRDHDVHHGEWRAIGQMDKLEHTKARNPTQYVKEVRNSIRRWCMSEAGKVPWQDQQVRKMQEQEAEEAEI